MKKRVVMVVVGVVVGVMVLLLISGPILRALGVEVFCIVENSETLRLARCDSVAEVVETEGGALTADKAPPVLAADAQPTLIDTDMAADDWMAILYLLQRPDVDVRAITVTGAGETHCGPGVQNALDLAALAGRPEIAVSCGREEPLVGDRVFPSSWRQNVDALAGLAIPRNPARPDELGAVELIAATAREAAGELEIVTLGPLTNVAEALLADPGLADMLAQVYIMGGAFEVAGNVMDAPEMGIDNEAAEWNMYVDPHAAAVVVASGAPLTFVPLDASNHVKLDRAFYERLGEERTTPEAEFVYQVLTRNIGFVQSGSYYFWDPLTAAIAVDEGLATIEAGTVAVVEEGPESGATRLDEAGYGARIALAAAGDRFRERFLDVLNGRVGE